MLRYCAFSWTSTRTSCYATARSLELPYTRHAALCSLGLPRVRHATLLHVLSNFHTYVMLRYCTFSWTSTRTSCYATARSLELPYMLRDCTFSWTSTRTSCYATARSLELPYIRHATLCSLGLPRMRFLRFLMKWALRS